MSASVTCVTAAYIAYAVTKDAVEEEEEARFRRIHARPDYLESVWWKMMETGDCKIDGHRENKRFRRRFGVSWKRFVLIVAKARTWRLSTDGDRKKTYGDVGNSATGVPCVPLELKILGWLRLNSKGKNKATTIVQH